jgi:predicted AlkP superfamily phosphohydrolase/phosphomutase
MRNKMEVKKFKDRTEYYKDGKLHRDNDRPAVEWYNGDKDWYQNGILHRVDGPAVEWANGCKWWYIEGVNYTEEGYAKFLSFGKDEVDKLKQEIAENHKLIESYKLIIKNLLNEK